jgi:hypothetical protein
MPFGFDFSKSKSSSSSFVDPSQQPFLDFLRNTGQSLYGQNGAGAQNFASQQGQALFNQGLGYANQAVSNPFLSSLQQMAQPGGNQQLIGQQIGQLGADLGRNFQQNLMPGIRRDAIGLGGFGGTRQGVAEGIAAQGTQDAFARGATQIYGQNAQMAQDAGIAGGNLLGQGALGAMGGLGGLFELGLGQYTGGFAPLNNLAAIIGGPTVLDQSKGRTTSFGGTFGGYGQ